MHTVSLSKAVMNLQLNFSPMLTILSFDREFASRLKRFAATIYSTSSSHSSSTCLHRSALNSSSLTKVWAATL